MSLSVERGSRKGGSPRRGSPQCTGSPQKYQHQHQHHDQQKTRDSRPVGAPLTSSPTNGILYFAYGSNLSPEQMTDRCSEDPDLESMDPIAIARLDGWKWIICERGYANVVPAVVSGGQATSNVGGKVSDHDDVVYGLIYDLSPGAESVLDGYEGHAAYTNPRPTPNNQPGEEERRRKPFLQGDWSYNKLYLPVTVTKWLDDKARQRQQQQKQGSDRLTVLIYVDELRRQESRPQREYVGRMNRAIEQSCALGMSPEWVERVMRKFIPSQR